MRILNATFKRASIITDKGTVMYIEPGQLSETFVGSKNMVLAAIGLGSDKEIGIIVGSKYELEIVESVSVAEDYQYNSDEEAIEALIDKNVEYSKKPSELDIKKQAIDNASNNVLKDNKDFIKLEKQEEYPDKFPVVDKGNGPEEQIPVISPEFFKGYINKIDPNIKVDIQEDIARVHYKRSYIALREMKEQIGEKYLKGVSKITVHSKIPANVREDALGYYVISTGEIGIRGISYVDPLPVKKQEKQEISFEHALSHEIGHSIYHKYTKKVAENFYENNKENIEKYYISVKRFEKSSTESASEFFAETLARYINGVIKENGTNPYENELFKFMKETLKILKEEK